MDEKNKVSDLLSEENDDKRNVAYIISNESESGDNELIVVDQYNINTEAIEGMFELLGEGKKLLYANDLTHEMAWREIYLTLKNEDTLLYRQHYYRNYYHSIKIYFDYCDQHGIDAVYMSRFDTTYCCVRKEFEILDKEIKNQTRAILNQYKGMDTVTKKCYEYLRNELYYDSLDPIYTLYDHTRKEYNCYFGHRDEAIMITQEYEIEKIEEWMFPCIWDVLHEDITIKYMNKNAHSMVLMEISDYGREEMSVKNQSSIKRYLKFCKKNHVEKILCEKEHKDILLDLYRKYNIPVNIREDKER